MYAAMRSESLMSFLRLDVEARQALARSATTFREFAIPQEVNLLLFPFFEKLML